MRDAAVSPRARLRLDRHQLAREEGIPTLSVLVGERSAVQACWERWLASHARPSARLDGLEEGSATVARRLGAAILEGRKVLHDVAAFVARHTGEPLDALEARLSTLGVPERTILLERAASASGQPELAALAGALLAAPGEPPPGITSLDDVVALLQLLPPQTRPGLLVEAPRVAPALALLLTIAERVPLLPVALATDPAELERFWVGPGSPRDQARVREGLVRLDDAAPEPASPEPVSSGPLEPLREELAQLCEELAQLGRAAPLDARAADRARSLAERLMFAALHDHPLTRGRFELNVRMPFAFGSRPAEVDLYSARDRIAIEIDGYHHFVDADAYRRDRRKDVLLQRHGLFVLRFLAQDVAPRLEQLVDRVLDVLHRPPAPGASA